MSLVEDIMRGGGLAGASEKQVRAILAKLESLAVVVEQKSLPQAAFDVTEGRVPVVWFQRDGSGHETVLPFGREHVSKKRTLTAVRRAMAIHTAVTADHPYLRRGYDDARDAYLRQQLEDDLVAEGAARSLAGGAL
ncbi:hypothetical protein ABC337_13885 [Arthrobacter sp. 1P04PC]|uniref:hypothetical protein n=1 Tax=unclassified Arthrobacter TaxID=235627 RepID=UPI00399F6CB1